MSIVAGRTMDKAGAVKDKPLGKEGLKFGVRERIIIREGHRMVVRKISADIRWPPRRDLSGRFDTSHRPQYSPEGECAVMTAQAES